MCGGYRLETDPDALAHALGVDHVQLELPWTVELYPGSQAPVALERRTAEGGQARYLGALRWGLVPSWADDPAVGRKLFNARVETLDDKPSFRQALRHRRCLVPAQAFYEWTGPAGKKQRHALWRADQALLTMAGLWEVWRSREGEKLGSFTIVTTAASRWVSPLHPRMPLLVPPSHHAAWLALDAGAPATLLTELVDLTDETEIASAPLPR